MFCVICVNIFKIKNKNEKEGCNKKGIKSNKV